MEEQLTTQEVPVTTGTYVIDEAKYQTLLKMLKSGDDADHKMAQLVLNQVDVQNSIYWIWRLARNGHWIASRMVNLRTKASREFRDKTDLFVIAHRPGYDFVRWLDSKDWLTPWIFQELSTEMENHISWIIKGINCSKFYNFTLEIKPEYKELNPSHQLKAIDYERNK